MRVSIGLLFPLLLGACAAFNGEKFGHVAPSASLTPQPHSAAEIAQFETFHGPDSNAAVRQAWREQFLDQRLSRAFAVSDQNFGSGWGWQGDDLAIDTALKSCRSKPDGATCRLYAVNTQIVYPGAEYTLPFRGRRYGPFKPSPEFIYYGPEKAKGLIVWSHGTYNPPGSSCGDDGAKYAPWATITIFNRRGWDVVRFDRDPCQDELPTALRQIPGGVAAAKAAGYTRIVLAGQSRGGIQSLESLRNSDVVHDITGVIAFSPANTGNGAGAGTLGAARWYGLVNGLSGNLPVAVFFFDKDEYNPSAKQQTDFARANWPERMPNAHVYFNDSQNMIGHGGAGRPAFTRKYASCLVAMMEGAGAHDACSE